jgi:cytochrome c oxidase assembly protein subunit 15
VLPLLRRLALGQLAVLVAVLYLGVVVTGSGPHAGDAGARRTGLDPETVSQLHADAVFLLVVSRWPCWSRSGRQRPLEEPCGGWPSSSARARQGVIGYVQYLTDLPVLLVGLHMLGASVLVVAAVHVALSTRDRGTAPLVPAPGQRSRLLRGCAALAADSPLHRRCQPVGRAGASGRKR